MNLVILENSNGLMCRSTQRTKAEAFSAAFKGRQSYYAEGSSGHPQRAASGAVPDRGTGRKRSSTFGGS